MFPKFSRACASGNVSDSMSLCLYTRSLLTFPHTAGWTSMGRTNEIFALTPAPVQIQYMGYPVSGLGFRVYGLGFRVSGLSFRPLCTYNTCTRQPIL
jgi:hypothetical protein